MSGIRVGVIGTGFMGATHLAAFRALAGAEVVGVVSRTGRLAGADVPVYASAAALVAEAGAELVSVCTPTTTHPALIRELVDLGVDIVCEKPLSLSLTEARQLVELCAERRRNLHVAHVVRFVEEYEKTAALVSSGRLGSVGTVRMRRSVPAPHGAGGWFRDPELSGGVAVDLMIHDFDFLVGLFGVPREVYAQRGTRGEAETVLATLSFENGAIAVVEGNWGGVNQLEYSCEVAGSAGSSSFASTPASGLSVTKTGQGGPSSWFESPAITDPYVRQLGSFLAVPAGAFAALDHAQALGALETSLMAARSAREGRVVVRHETTEVSR